MTFAKDQKVKVMGGAHKGKWGYVFREMNEFCMITIMDYKKAIARGDDEDLLVKREVRAKTKYLEVIPETIFEMPDESDLMPVYTLTPEEITMDCYTEPAVEIALDKIIEDLKMPIPENDDDLLSNHSDDESVDIGSEATCFAGADNRDPEDITDILPSVTEALQLRKDVKELTRQNNELTEAFDLFVKLCDFVRHRRPNGGGEGDLTDSV